jgi:dihydrofolate reductase
MSVLLIINMTLLSNFLLPFKLSMKKPFDLIVAIDEKNGIGKQGRLPWTLSKDMQHFKAVTMKTSSHDRVNAVVMGRKTWESIPEKFRPLAGRLNLVLTKNKDYQLPNGVLSVQDLDAALDLLNGQDYQAKIAAIFVIGGASVYHHAIGHPLCRKIYVTKIEDDFLCDTFFPSFEDQFQLVDQSVRFCEKGINYFFCEYKRF